ncbi:MAG: Asp-tRNA(Asn)/Glu-tRNA(Gln) amidotransferase subunit GatB [bacterium]|nr:Asp-tRNA(Asn)/Glu-tRNA(Gln) amidotransferase subunit GatB [bacterium]
MAARYEPVIGLEIHVQLRTKSKMFCRCDNRADDAQPNELTCPVCLGLPGTLPVPNRTAVEWALKAALALGCKIPKYSKFDRKQYFYPDLPKGYQISQYDQPLGGPGTFEFDMPEDGKVVTKKVGITRLHLEEDAGKLTHPKGADYSLVDLNRAGTPLAEIVTEPDFRSPAEAKRFLQELRRLMRYLGVSDADMEKGHLRADANISMRPAGSKGLGTKTELKNLNSFRFVEKGLAAEIERQTGLLENGAAVAHETRGYNEDSGTTVSQRGKEEAHDYRYFPEPDIPPLEPEALGLEQLQESLPELPVARRRRYRDEYGLSEEDAEYLVDEPLNANYFEERIEEATTGEQAVEDAGEAAGAVAKMLTGPYAALLKSGKKRLFTELAIEPGVVSDLARLLIHDRISWQGVKEILNTDDATHFSDRREALLKRYQPVAADDIEAIVDAAIKDNPKPVADFKAGNENARQVIVGRVMKATKGAADATAVAELITKKLR